MDSAEAVVGGGEGGVTKGLCRAWLVRDDPWPQGRSEAIAVNCRLKQQSIHNPDPYAVYLEGKKIKK